MSPEAHACCGDFWLMLEEVITTAHGRPGLAMDLADAPLRDVVNLLAPNGIRMTFMPEKHLDHEPTVSKS
jgi:hypothetical protein